MHWKWQYILIQSDQNFLISANFVKFAWLQYTNNSAQKIRNVNKSDASVKDKDFKVWTQKHHEKHGYQLSNKLLYPPQTMKEAKRVIKQRNQRLIIQNFH